MSSLDVDVDINVVSSPEPSPRSDERVPSRNEYHFINHHHHHHNPHTFNNNNNNINNNSQSTESRLSPPPKSSPEHSNGKTSASAYTSFSITSILSRAEPKKGSLTAPLPMPLTDLNGGSIGTTHDAAMLSR